MEDTTKNTLDPAEQMFNEVMGDYMGDDDASSTATQETPEQEQHTEAQHDQQPTREVGNQQPQSNTQESPQDTRSQEQQVAPNVLNPHPATMGAPNEQRLYTDSKGNIVNANGNIVYAAGKERRTFEQNVNAQNHVQSLNKTIATLQTEIQQLRDGGSLDSLAQQHGLNRDTLTEALKFRARYDRDPLGTMREMIALTMQNGYTAEQLLGGNDGRPDPQAMIAAAVNKALTDAGVVHNNPQQQQPQQDGPSADYQRLAQTYPQEVQMHDRVLAQLLPHMPGETMFIKGMNAVHHLRNYATQHGLDMSKDLMPQLQALEAARQQRTQAPANTPPSIPNGSSMIPGAVTTTDASPLASVEKSFDDIIRESMQASGMRF